MDVCCSFCKNVCENGVGSDTAVICNNCIVQMYEELEAYEDAKYGSTKKPVEIPAGWSVLSGGLVD